MYVVKDSNDPRLFSQQLIATKVNWLSGKQPKFPLTCRAVIRYRHPTVKCEITHSKISPFPEATFGTSLRERKRGGDDLVKFSQPQRAITPGQSVVFYRLKRRTTNTAHPNEDIEEEVLGGGIIQIK